MLLLLKSQQAPDISASLGSTNACWPEEGRGDQCLLCAREMLFPTTLAFGLIAVGLKSWLSSALAIGKVLVSILLVLSYFPCCYLQTTVILSLLTSSLAVNWGFSRVCPRFVCQHFLLLLHSCLWFPLLHSHLKSVAALSDLQSMSSWGFGFLPLLWVAICSPA